MNLARSRDAFATGSFEDVLAEQLRENTNHLPLAHGCESGGWPQDVQIVSVAKVAEDAESIHAEATITFNEAFGTGCSETLHEQSRLLYCQVTICKATGQGRVQVAEEAE